MCKILRGITALFSTLFLSRCTTEIPEGVKPVQGFELKRYLGKWYEIARLDHPFERGLTHASALYKAGREGQVIVLNRGYDPKRKEWKEAEGKAYLVGDPKLGHLKVSFFGPFYGSYIVFELDHKGYQYAFVTGYSKDYLWFLSRTPTVPESLRQHFLATVAKYGFDVKKITFVNQESPVPPDENTD
jgi:apolipoprotein D and lipocalin family protein